MQLAAAHGSSHADMLTVFAATCPDRMSATVNIPAHCEAAGFPLYVRTIPAASMIASMMLPPVRRNLQAQKGTAQI